LAHGWGSGPTSALSKYVLGVRPVEPGYKTWLIEPQTGDLSWAEGTVPTPYGPIEVKWRKTSKGLSLKINVPDGTSGTVGVPANGPSSSLTDNGQPAQEAKKSAPASPSEAIPSARPGYTYLKDLGPGTHVIQVTGGQK
jgi:alpha-L-rhamnosidase